MAQDLSGLLTKATSTLSIEGDALIPDFKEVEKTVFARDGLVTGSEQINLLLLQSLGSGLILSEDDKKRWELLSRSGFTLPRYFDGLKKLGLNPVNGVSALEAISKNQIEDYTYQLVDVAIHSSTDVSVAFHLKSPEGVDYRIELPQILPKDAEGILELNKQIAPLTVTDVLTSIHQELKKPLAADFATLLQGVYVHYTEQNTELTATLMRQLAKIMQYDPSSLRWSQSLTAMKNSRSVSGLDTIFTGDTPTQEQIGRIKEGWAKLPANIKADLKQARYKIRLVSDETLKQLAAENKEIGASPQFAGLTDPKTKMIYVLTDIEPAHLKYTLVHEIAHAWHDVLSSKKGGSQLAGSPTDEVIKHHFDNQTAYQDYDQAPTVYGSTNYTEWFAESLTTVIFADEINIGDSLSENGIGGINLNSRFQQRDPVGHALISYLLDRSNRNLNPECVFNWRDYHSNAAIAVNPAMYQQEGESDLFSLMPLAALLPPSIQLPILSLATSTRLIDMFSAPQGPIDIYHEQIESIPCDPLDAPYREAAKQVGHHNVLKKLFDIYKGEDYPPIKDAIANSVFGLFLMPGGRMPINGVLVDTFFTDFVETPLLKESRPVLINVLNSLLSWPLIRGTLAQEDSIEKWGKLSEISDVQNRLITLASKLYARHPDEQMIKMVQVLSLIHQEKYTEAIKINGELSLEMRQMVALVDKTGIEKTNQQRIALAQIHNRCLYLKAKIARLLGNPAEELKILESLKYSNGIYMYPSDLAHSYINNDQWEELDKLLAQIDPEKQKVIFARDMKLIGQKKGTDITSIYSKHAQVAE